MHLILLYVVYNNVSMKLVYLLVEHLSINKNRTMVKLMRPPWTNMEITSNQYKNN